ncbi:MAG: mechanosensitive ion channel domain-containing protein [Acidimicrobiales bacterium]
MLPAASTVTVTNSERHLWETPLHIAIIVVTTLLITWLARRAIRKFIRGIVVVRGIASREVGERVQARTSTLSVVLRSTVTGLLWMMALLAIISELGVNLGAFVAAATIIGGALAFGAQTIVRDFLAGIFVLVEDQYGVGDIVDLGLASGQVERVTLRSTRLRDDEGRVWHVPNGQVLRAGNLSQEWGQAVLDVPVSLDADVGAMAVELERIAGELAADPEFAEKILEPPHVLGVQELLNDRAALRLTMKTRPAEQFAVMREMRQRVLTAERDGLFHLPPRPQPGATAGQGRTTTVSPSEAQS